MQNPFYDGHAVPSTQSGIFGSFGQPSSVTQGGTPSSNFGSFAMQQPISTAGSFGTSGTLSGQPSVLFGSSVNQGGQQSSALSASGGSATFGSFGIQGSQMSSFGAPQAGQSSSTFGSFGTQSTSTFGTQKEQPTPIFGSIGSHGGQSQAVFGSFGAPGAQARQSSTFGTHNEQSPSKFGSFGSQGPESASAFGSFGAQGGQQSSPIFGSTNNQEKPSPSIFGGSSGISSGMFRGEHKLGSTFGAATSLPGSNTFGSTAATAKSLFGTFTGQASVSVSQSFGSQMNTQSVTSSGTQSIFGKPTFSSSSLTGTATFSLNQPKTTNSSSFPVSSSSLFTSASPSTSPTAGSLFSASQQSNLRKRNFESEGNTNVLFGKKDRSESTMEGPSSLTTIGPFTLKQTATSFNVSSVPVTFQPGEKSLFGKSVSTAVENTEAPKSLFGKPVSDSKTETTLFKPQLVGRSLFSASDATKESSSSSCMPKQEHVATGESVFRKNIENSSSLKQAEAGLFSVPAQCSLFGKDPSGGSSTSLFGKPSQPVFSKINRSASSFSLQQLNEKESVQGMYFF